MSAIILAGQINAALDAHAKWKQRLNTAIERGHCDSSPSDIACDDKCAFGKWLHGDAMPQTVRDGVPYQVTKRLHAEFHKTAGQVATLVEAGDRVGARHVLTTEYAERSDKLSRALNKWRSELMMPA
ncbi:CZB domain-containing protein [Maritimibacter sp. DP1N21-5]|uniref:CZB domain-containing protein n=1 Tax=Maritimibacter sp. DP1N21-5 TaxID=2836867 RepID=UPI001C47F98C|nr:CZB domain-containing protein [Maritimibacter sp. DP1N21-5]MBV7407894.1 CZB domain-containing protein [Maritimibacter sp. DP1N21-5]